MEACLEQSPLFSLWNTSFKVLGAKDQSLLSLEHSRLGCHAHCLVSQACVQVSLILPHDGPEVRE